MRIGFDIGGVISKYPQLFYDLCCTLHKDHILYIITDQHPKQDVFNTLLANGWFSEYKTRVVISPENVYCADYEKYGNMAKAVLIKELNLDIFIDDFDGYLQWDSSLGPQPLLLKVQCDAFKPYWSDTWKQDGGDFGRRKYVKTN